MKFTIDNFDGAGARDYSHSIDAERPPRVQRRLNRVAELAIWLLADSPQFVVPAHGARAGLSLVNGGKIFTGYVADPAEHEYLGWGERGPVYRYQVVAHGEESLLDRKVIVVLAPFVSCPAGSVLKQLAESVFPGCFDTSAVQDVVTLPSFSSDPRKTWSEHAADLALRARACYRVLDGKLIFEPVGATRYSLLESSPGFHPGGLKLRSRGRLLNDVTVVGLMEPRAHVKDYFLGDGLTLGFGLSHLPFTRYNQVLVDEEYKGASLSGLYWTVADPGAVVSVSGGQLHVQGGAGQDGQTSVLFARQVELGGAVILQHGDVTFTAPSDGVLGGLYSGNVAMGDCLAGFRIAPAGSQSTIQALVNGAVSGTPITTAAGHRYALSTRLYASEVFRKQQIFHSSTHPADNGRGGSAIAADVHVVLEVHDVDPSSPGSQAAAATVLYDGMLSAAPGYCAYALVNAINLRCSIAFTRILRAIDAEVRTALPGVGYRTRLVGYLSEGAECGIYDTPELQFFSPYVPAPNEKIAVRYRSRGRALARVSDPASIGAMARANDDGVRAGVRSVAAPSPRTAADCENSALALLDDGCQSAWAGEYQVWSDCFPGPDADIFPGDAIQLDVPSRGASFEAIVREVDLDLPDLAADRTRYRIAFANDAAEPLGFELQPARLSESLEATVTTATAGTTFIADLRAAEVTNITSTTIEIDAGTTPPAGAGIEVRRSDSGWGTENDQNLIGRFTTRTLTVTRLSRVQTYLLRQYDASSPRKYSRYSAALHVDYPL